MSHDLLLICDITEEVFGKVVESMSLKHPRKRHVVSSPKHAECLKCKKEAFEHMEVKLNTGLERIVNSIMAWTKILLSKEQKKNEFQPETDDIDMVKTSVTNQIKYFKTKAFHCLFSVD